MRVWWVPDLIKAGNSTRNGTPVGWLDPVNKSKNTHLFSCFTGSDVEVCGRGSTLGFEYQGKDNSVKLRRTEYICIMVDVVPIPISWSIQASFFFWRNPSLFVSQVAQLLKNYFCIVFFDWNRFWEQNLLFWGFQCI
jgi:hypothetical protein